MPTDTLTAFLTAPPAAQARIAHDPQSRSELERYMGRDAFAEYAAIARGALDTEHLAVDRPVNMVFVPGIMGSLLHSAGLGAIWWVDVRTRDRIDDLQLTADGKEDKDPTYQIAPATVDLSYTGFRVAAHARTDFNHVAFPYDWRKSLSRSSAALRDTITTIRQENPHEPVHLVGHSMGGLLIRVALMEHGAQLWPQLGRIVFIGTPHYGSPAIAAYLKYHLRGFNLLAVLGRYLSPATLRSLWGAIELLPAPRGIYPGTRTVAPSAVAGTGDGGYDHPCANFDLHAAGAYELGLAGLEADAFQRALTSSAQLHQRLYSWHMALDQDRRNQMAVIAGVGVKTLFRLAYRRGVSKVIREMESVTRRVKDDPNREGDGRVPLASAALEYVGDTRYFKGVHDALPNQQEVYDDVFRWLAGEEMQLATSPAGALIQHLGAEQGASETPHLDGTYRVIRNAQEGDDPGWLDLTEPDAAQLDEIDRQLDRGLHPEFHSLKLL